MVRQVRRFLMLTRNQRSLLLRAGGRVVLVRFALWLLPFHSVCAWAQRSRSVSSRLAATPAEDLAWAVRATARRIPLASCLTRALALQSLLAQAGRCASLRIGVARDPAGGLDAHAWIECDGKALDEPAAARFMRLTESRSP